MKYYIALYQKLRDIYTSQSAQENDVALICPSLRLYEKEDLELLKPLQESSKTADSILKKQQVSYELNSLPFSNTFWDLNPSNSLFDVYREILERSKIKNLENRSLEIEQAEKEKLYDANNKDSKELKSYQKYLSLYEKSIIAIEEHLALFDDQNTDEEKENWQNQLSILQSKSKKALADLEIKGYKNIIETALEKVNHNSEIDVFLDTFQTVKNNFSAAEKTDVISNSSIHDINFIPYDFMVNESGWSNLKLDKTELDALFIEAQKNAENLPSEILSLNYDEKYIKGIELDYSFVHLKRNWFNKSIFNSPHFLWEEPKSISDGVTISNQYKLPAFPKAMILIKNLKINLDPNVSDGQVNNPNQLIYFGPLILKQQLFVNKRSNQKFLKAVTNKETIKSDQLNYMVKKSEVTAVETPLEKPVFMAKPMMMSMATTSMASSRVAEDIPIASTTKPIESIKMHSIFVSPTIFTTIVTTPVVNLAKVFFFVTDSISMKGIYKTNISIKGTDNNRFFEIETNEKGEIVAELPIGNYDVELKADGYGILTSNIKVENTNNLNQIFSLKREEITFKSYFLIGMICEKIPKTPQ